MNRGNDDLMKFPTPNDARGNTPRYQDNNQYVVVGDQAIATNTLPPLPRSRQESSKHPPPPNRVYSGPSRVEVSGSVATAPSSSQYRVDTPPSYHRNNSAYDSYYANRSSGNQRPRRPVGSGASQARSDSGASDEHQVPNTHTPKAHSEQYLISRFKEFDSRNLGLLSEKDLSVSLRNGDHSRFGPDTVRVIVRMFDEDGDDAINFQEFKKLWSYLFDYREIFNQFDRDGSGDINLSEFSRALHSFGYRLSGPCIKTIFFKYARLKPSPDHMSWDRVISFDKFVLCCIHLLNTTTSFKRFDYNRDGYATIGFEDYLVEVTTLRN